jgi:hypothetical protein
MKTSADTVALLMDELLKDLDVIQKGENLMCVVNGCGATTLMEQLITYRDAVNLLEEQRNQGCREHSWRSPHGSGNRGVSALHRPDGRRTPVVLESESHYPVFQELIPDPERSGSGEMTGCPMTCHCSGAVPEAIH